MTEQPLNQRPMNERQTRIKAKQFAISPAAGLALSRAAHGGAMGLTFAGAMFLAATFVGPLRSRAANDVDAKAPAPAATTAPAGNSKPNPFADEQATKEKPPAKADVKPDDSDPFASTPAKGKINKADAKGPGDLLGGPTSPKKDEAKPAADPFPSFDNPGKKPATTPQLLPIPGLDQPADAKTPADAKSSDKPPRTPGDVLSDTKSTDQPATPGQVELKHGQELLDKGQYKEAVESLKKAVKLSPTEAGPHYTLGVAYRMLNQYDDAIVEFSEAVKIDSALSDAFLRRGVCWYYKDEFALAQSDFDDASGGSANDPRPLTWKGMTLVRLGQLRDAVNVYSEALRYDNHYAPAHVNRGLAYIALKEYDKAVADFDEAIRSTPKDASLYFKRGVAQGGLKDWSGAVRSYSEAIRLNPKNGDAYTNRSLAYRRLGDADKAQADLEKAQQLKPAQANSKTTQPLKSTADRAGQGAVR